MIYQVFQEPVDPEEIQKEAADIPQSLEDFVAEMKDTRSDAKTFATKLKSMVLLLLFLPI